MKASSKRQAACGRLRGPGFRETLRELLFGVRRRMDCIQVEVSSRCPGRCGYCPHTTRQGTWRSRDMDMDMETFTMNCPVTRGPAPTAGKTSPDPYSCRPTGPSRRAST